MKLHLREILANMLINMRPLCAKYLDLPSKCALAGPTTRLGKET